MQEAEENHWTELATKHWLKETPTKIQPDALKKEIWDVLQADSFSPRSLVPLENLQILERFLWPTFSQSSTNYHVLLITIFVNLKQRGRLHSWTLFESRPDEVSHLFRRVLSLTLDSSLPISQRLALLNFVIAAFGSLDRELVRKECAPLVSIAIWQNLHSEEARDVYLHDNSTRRKAWRSASKRYEAADKSLQAKMRFDQSWLTSMVLDFMSRVNTTSAVSSEDRTYCEKFLEFVIDLISQLPTRRYTNILLKDLNFAPILKSSRLYEKQENSLLRDLVILFEHFHQFEVDTGNEQDGDGSGSAAHIQSLKRLQRLAFKHFESTLKILALSNYSSLENRGELESHLSALSDDELRKLCELLHFRTQYPSSTSVVIDRRVLLEILISAHEKPEALDDVISRLSLMPTEQSLYGEDLLRDESYDGVQPLSKPKLNLQYLNLKDFLWRSFKLHQEDAFYAVRTDVDSTIRRLKPRPGKERGSTVFEGFSKMAIPIEKPGIIEVAQPKVGTTTPGYVRAEVALDVSRLGDSNRRDWENLHVKDVVFLLAVRATENNVGRQTNGNVHHEDSSLLHLRAAEVVQVLDDEGRPLREHKNMTNGHRRPLRRRLLLDLDPTAFQADKEKLTKGKSDVYGSINVVVRRQGRENNFRPVLETIQKLVGSQTELPTWFQEVFLGYGDPTGATYPNLTQKIEKLDLLDTFLNWDHLQNSFPARKVVSRSDVTGNMEPPYVLDLGAASTVEPTHNPRKRRRDQMEEDGSTEMNVSSYKPRNTGPYRADIPRKNATRFTPKQVEAIVSGTQPGLSVIVGPPGTGKTDVATQIINLLYHKFTSERVLLIAHSNQALNQLFQKIVALDIDPRHLLRLGHGEGELETEASFSRYGRVESFLDDRQAYLTEVARLAASLQVEGAHGSTCETADYFNQVYIKPAWTRFWHNVEADDVSAEALINDFPFHQFFANIPSPPLFPAKVPVEQLKEIASGCQYHIEKIFSELDAIRPFEILRHPRDQQNHLLVKEARIIAMTSTHAAMRRSEIADLGFHYDTLVMEEAAQITEIESFIPCAMQNQDTRTGELPLKRIVLVGDHFQNSPVISNTALKEYSNFEQSMFLRLVRLGVPTINLDQQGRCRPSLAELFKWRYGSLGNLPHLMELPEFARANAGFKYDYQFIDVPDYQGQGERVPTPHFIQNLGEAEYAVALYQYMRLLGYPAQSISILAAYAGQRALIKDVLDHRCKDNGLFGLPKIVATIDKYQGEQNDYVILSMTRTRSVGYLRDVRRLTVALSRARLGLYILGRRDVFESCFEMKPAMDIIFQRPSKLVLTTGEMVPTTRKLDDNVKGTEMEGVEHLGQYVYEMTQAKVKAMGGQVSDANGAPTGEEAYVEDIEVEEDTAAGVDEEDPLHENVV